MMKRLVTSAAFAGMPLYWRRRAMRAYWRTECLTGRADRFGLRPVFRSVLRLPDEDAARVDREIAYHDLIGAAEWASLLRRSKSQIHRDTDRTTIRDRGLLERLARSRQPVILAPLHMGCFALPFARIMHDHFIDRSMLILRAREDLPQETAAMRRISEIGIDMRFLNVRDKQNYVDAVRFARAGAVIVSFVDLPASYGGPAPVKLFGRDARLAMGIGSLARLTEATVVPLAVRSSMAGDIVDFGRPFQSLESGPDEKARVADLVRRHIETSVLAHPEQWHMWSRFDEFLAPPGPGAASDRLSA